MSDDVMIRDLRPGDVIDLEGDEYADPSGDLTSFQYLYAEVAAVEIETPGCTVLHIEGVDAFGFPPDHEVRRVARGIDESGEGES